MKIFVEVKNMSLKYVRNNNHKVVLNKLFYFQTLLFHTSTQIRKFFKNTFFFPFSYISRFLNYFYEIFTPTISKPRL